MKKSILAFILLIFILCSGCRTLNIEKETNKTVSNSIATQETTISTEKIFHGTISNEESNEASVDYKFDSNKVLENIKVTPYSYKSMFSYNFVVLLKNNSEMDCELNFSVDFLDENGNIVGTESDSVDAFASGTEVALTFYCDDEFSSYEYTMEVSQLEYYKCVTQNLSCEVNIATDKSIISVTNNGDIDADFVEYTALYFYNDTLVDTDWGYIVDDDSQIKSHKTQKEESTCYEDFDTVRVYLDARASDF